MMARIKRWIADPRLRRRGYALAALVLAILCVLPRPYAARAKIVPQDPNSVGLGSTLNALGGQLGGFAALLGGGKQPIDLYLAIARGREVTDAVIAQLKLVDRYGSARQAQLAVAKKVDIHSLTGGVIEIEARTHDPQEAQALTQAHVAAITARLNALQRERLARKQAIVRERFAGASARVAAAETALDTFRRQNRLAEPEAQLGAELSLRAGLQAQLQAKLVEMETLGQFQGPDNPQLRALQSEVASLRAQIARSAAPSEGAAGPNVAGLSAITSAYLNRYRDYRFAQALFEVYSRASEEVAVESLTAESASDVQVIEAARVDADAKFNISAVALLALVLALALFTEVYAPATGLKLPLIGDRT
ncbi:capsule biosynthesis protein [Sphingomonas azotifigens]|uniref:capsule biosynthesis protein n=1 Tax=Sphingomonas azotifigens TaxID=330920 RepID=UPI000A056212|nr:capsule biosynthesis protein [Sphingomonas azotifigens]